MNFVLRGADAIADEVADWDTNFLMLEGDTLVASLDRYADVERRTTDIIASLPDLDADHALPEAPWYEPGAR